MAGTTRCAGVATDHGLLLLAPLAARAAADLAARDAARHRRSAVGLVDRRADRDRAGRDDPADGQAAAVVPRDAGAAARDQEAAGQAQERPPEAQRGDDGVLQGEQGQPVRVVPAAPDPAADLLRPVRDAEGHRQGGDGGREPVDAGWLDPGYHRLAQLAARYHAVPADVRLRDLADGLHAADADLGRPEAEVHLPVPPDRVRVLHRLSADRRVELPVGLLVYWITTNLWTVGQAFVIRQWFPPPLPPSAKVQPAAAGGGGFAGLLGRGKPSNQMPKAKKAKEPKPAKADADADAGDEVPSAVAGDAAPAQQAPKNKAQRQKRPAKPPREKPKDA